MKDRKIVLIIVLVLVSGCFLYYSSRLAYTAYESIIDAHVVTPVAGIHIKINGVDAVSNNDGTLDNRVILDNITWTSTHTRQGKLSPGSSGTIDLEIDPAGSEVAIMYEFRFVDKRIDDDKLLNFGSITSSDGVIRTGNDTYAGIITLADINNNRKFHISANFYFDYLVDIEGITEDNQELDDLFEIHFHAVQYNGETLQQYVEPEP